MMTNKTIKRRFTLMQFLLWFTFGTFGIFYVAYLKDLGYSSKFIALGLILSTITGIGAQYLWGYISDMTSAIKGTFMGLLVGLIGVVALFQYGARTGPTTILILMLFGFTWMPLEALLDSWILSSEEIDNGEYGSIRSGGSLGFSVITIFFGSLIVRFGFGISVVSFTVSGLLLFLVALTTRTHTTKKPTKMGMAQIRQLLANRHYVFMLLFSVLIFVNHMGINNFYIYVVQQVGGNEGLIGQAAAVAAFTEIFGFWIGGKLQKRFNPLLIMIFVAIGFFLRVFFLAQAVTFAGVLMTASMQGMMFSLFLGTFKVYITEITPIALLATAQTVAASTYFGIASVIANIFGGLLIDDYGLGTFYNFMMVISAIAIILIMVMYYNHRRNNNGLGHDQDEGMNRVV